MKHYEDIWNESEIIAREYFKEKNLSDISEGVIISSLKELLFESKTKKASFGKLLFYLCYLSDKYKVNVWTALTEATDDFHSEMLDDE